MLTPRANTPYWSANLAASAVDQSDPRALIEALYGCRFLQWNEPSEDGPPVFSAIRSGHLILADSLELIIQALAVSDPLRVAA